MSRHQQQLTLVHKHRADLETRLRNMAAVGRVSRPVATQLQEQLDNSSGELEAAEGHMRELERHYFAARTWLFCCSATVKHAGSIQPFNHPLSSSLHASAACF